MIQKATMDNLSCILEETRREVYVARELDEIIRARIVWEKYSSKNHEKEITR